VIYEMNFHVNRIFFNFSWHKNYAIYGWTTFTLVLVYVVVIYILTRCISPMGIYILFYNILVSMGCLYYLLQVFQFYKTGKRLEGNQYNDYDQSDVVHRQCYRDDFPPPLLQMLIAFLIVAIVFAFFPLLLLAATCCSALFRCNRGDHWYQRICQYCYSKLRIVGTNCYVLLAICSAIVFLVGLFWGLAIICSPRHHQNHAELPVAVGAALLAVASWFDIYLIGHCICFGDRCCCSKQKPWFCLTDVHRFCFAFLIWLRTVCPFISQTSS